MQLSRSLSSTNSGAAGEMRRMKPFACFRLLETTTEFERGRSLDAPSKQVLTRVAEGEEDRQTFPRMSPATVSSVKDDVRVFRPRKKTGCFGLSRILKLILSNRTRKARQKCDPKFKTQDLKAKNQQTCEDEDSKIISNTCSCPSSLASTAFTSPNLCSCSSSPAHDSRSSSDLHDELFRSNPKKLDQTVEERPRSRSWWWFLLICISSLILWGKICALWCSMAWLFFFLHRKIHFSPMKKKNTAIDSQDRRKKVILEGLLDRDSSDSQTLPTKQKRFLF